MSAAPASPGRGSPVDIEELPVVLPLRTILAVATVAVAASACSSHSVAPAADRTVDVVMVDNAFEPTSLQVSEGETITFSFRNTGSVTHEATIGDDAVQSAHAEEMSTTGTDAPDDAEDDGHGDDGHGDGDARSVTVEPGQVGTVTHTFDRAGTLLIGCHEPGHWEAGMKATISVA